MRNAEVITTVHKPSYRVPAMTEIAALPQNGFSVVSTFSGGGGSCLGYRMAGFRVIWANEFIKSAQETYRANFPDTYLDKRDIRQIEAADILRQTNLKAGDIDLFDGSPPCDPFSLAGAREKKWGTIKAYSNTEQRTDDLSLEFVRLLKDLQPRTFVMENVAGLLYGKAKGYFKEILQNLKSCGYKVTVKLLDAQWLGVPQMRQRAIFVGVREDLPFQPAHPKPLCYRYSIREAFGGAKEIEGEHRALKEETKLYRLWQWTRKRGKTYFDAASRALYGKASMFNHCVANFDTPCPTICQGALHLYHPTEPRTLTIPELKRIASFPDDFNFTGSFAQTWERIGNSVPPVMMEHIAAAIRDTVLLASAT